MIKTRWEAHRSWIRAIALIGISLGWLLLPNEPHAQSPALVDAINDSATTSAGVSVTIPVLANDRGTGLSIIQVDNPAQGTAVLSGDSVIYTPKAGFAGLDVFGYTISDGTSLDSATVVVTVNPPPPPVATDDVSTTRADVPVIIDVLANDTGSGIQVTTVTSPPNGRVTTSASGIITYTPTASFVGTDTFAYTITDAFNRTALATVTVTVTRTLTAANDTATTPADTAVTINVLANDTQGASIRIASVQSPTAQNGSATLSGSSISYRPATGFVGTDTFTYTITDGISTATATVTITVTRTLTAANDTATTPAGTAATINVLANDTQGASIRIASVQSPTAQNGSATISGSSISYRPATGFAGIDTFTYTITDGISTAVATVTVTVTRTLTAANDTATTTAGVAATINVLANDTQGVSIRIASIQSPTAQNGSATLSGSSISYRPATGFADTDTFAYTITDGISTATATVTITVRPLELSAVNDTATTTAGTAVTINVLANDTGSSLSLTQTGSPSYGSITISDSIITYRPQTSFAGIDVFTYTITDTFGRTATATVTVTVNAPQLNVANDAVEVIAGAATTINVLANDTGSGLAVTQVSTPSHGSATLSGTIITYRPETGFTGTDTFSYTITDEFNRTATATVAVTVNPTPLNAANDTATTSVEAAITINVLANDTGSGLAVTQFSTPAHGSATVSGNLITYRPEAGFAGTDVFTYTITDVLNRTATATITVTVNPPQLNAASDSATAAADIAVTINPLANDTGSGLAVTQVSTPAHGAATLSGNIITYRPETGFAGADTFTYTITDAFNRTATTTITVTVSPSPLGAVNDAAVVAPGGTVAIDVLANDIGSGLALTQISTPSHGVATVSGNVITYRPETGFTGVDAFSYTITDGVNTATSTVTVTIKPATELLPEIPNNPNAQSVGSAVGNSCASGSGNAELVRDCTALVNAASSNDPNASVALEQITPQAVNSAVDISESSAQSQTSSINARMFSLRSGVGIKGINLDRLRLNIQRGGWTLSGQDLRYLLASVEGGGTPSAEVDDDWGAFGVFASGSINLGSKDETENQAGFDFKSRELTLGADYRLSEQFALGAALSYSAVKNTIDSNGGALDSQGFSLSLYGIYHPGDNFYVNGIINYGWNDYDQKRNLSYQLETAQVNQQFNSSYGGQQFSVDLGVGYQFGYGDLRFGPEARLNYLTIGVDSFAEQASDDSAGSAWAVRLDEQNTQSLTLSLGAQISVLLEQSWGTLQPRMALSWLHELKDNAPRVRGRFVAADDIPSNYFELVGDALDQNYFRIDLGLGARFNQGPNAVLQYRMLMGYDNLTEQSIMAELRWDF